MTTPPTTPPLASSTAGAPSRRPAYHLTPRRHFMNDPNGLVLHDGVHHLFFQHNADGDTHANSSWGHATSPDLVHWTEQPVAIRADADEEVWSGSAVLDRDDTSGLGAGRPVLVAVYTSRDRAGGGQSQRLAASADGGTTWTKDPAGPVLDIG